MKTSILTVLLAVVSLTASAQGKVSFGNSTDRYFVLGDPAFVLPADMAIAGGTASTVSNTVSGCPGAIPMSPLPSGVTLVAALYGGTTAGNMTLQASVTLDATGWFSPGRMVNRNVILTGIPGGTPAFFQIYVYDNKYATPQAAFEAGGYYATTGQFTAIPGGSISYPSLVSGSLAQSTWGPGNLVLGPLSPPPPYPWVGIVTQPTNQMVLRGASATFWVQATSNYPLYYQWFFGGTSIPGANSASYTIPHAQPTNAGTYSVRASTASVNYGPVFAYSSNAILTVLVPPSIISPPSTQTAETGSTVLFGATAEGDPPLVFRWFFNGSQATGSATTNAWLKLTNIQPSQAGPYTVVVSNQWGTATSAPAMLSVISPVPRRVVPAIALTAQPASWMNIDYKPTPVELDGWMSFPILYITNAPQFFFDLSEPLPAQRIYRAWHSNALAIPPGLDMHTVPAITLTGAVGSTLRLDYINQFGPTDAWVPLATNTLTSPSQLYFDTFSIGQPPRLYRLTTAP